VVSDSANLELAQQFMDYVLSPEGQSVLEKYGFISAP
jgi:ABC-type molybdate transport system substrate-binding protein